MPTSDLIELYKSQKKEYFKLISRSKQNYYRSLISSSANKQKLVWSLVKIDLNREIVKPKITLNYNNKSISSPDELAQARK